MITEDYVSFETAKLLKEKGFDKYPLFPCYKEDNGEFIDIPTTLDTINYCFIPAPTLQMAMKWLREVHHIFIRVIQTQYSEYCTCEIYYNRASCYTFRTAFNSYEEACEAAIKYYLEKLI